MPAGLRAALLGFLALALPVLALVAKLPTHPLILGLLNNAAHAPVFGALAVTLLALLRRRPGVSQAARYGGAWLLAIAVGGVIELIQPLIGRGAEWRDVLTDALGAAAGLAIAWLWEHRRAAAGWHAKLPAILVLAVSVTIAAWPLGEAAIAYANRASRFPTLLTDQLRFDRYFVHFRGVEATHVEPAGLTIRIVGRRYPGVTLVEPSPDWTGYQRLMLDLENPGDRPLTLTLRVHDRDHDNRAEDRFNRDLELEPRRRTTIAIALDEIADAPQGRALDLSGVAGIILYSSGSRADIGREYRVFRIWLD